MSGRVRMFCDWDNDSKDLLDRLKAQTDHFYGNDFRGINFVVDDSYTHAICFNFPEYDLKSPPENNVALLLEPPELIVSMYKTQAKKTYDNVRDIYSFAFMRDYSDATGIGFATVPDIQYTPLLDKPNKICMIVSDKLMTPWHRRRQEIRDALLETDLPIDFYGRGMELTDDPRVKGEIPPMKKYDILDKYQICIDFENSKHGAITDKFFDPVLCNTVPVSNAAILSTIVDQDAFFYISFDWPTKEIIKEISSICEDELDEGRAAALEAARFEIRQGKMCLANWIVERVMENEAPSLRV